MNDKQSRYFQHGISDGSSLNVDSDLMKLQTLQCIDQIIKGLDTTSSRNCDGGLYVGLAGSAYAFYYVIKCGNFSEHTSKLVDKTKVYIEASLNYYSKKQPQKNKQVSFLLQHSGVYAAAALFYNLIGDQKNCETYVEEFRALASYCLPLNFLDCGSDELFVGRSGYLMGVLLLQRDLNISVLPQKTINLICQTIIESGLQCRSRLRFEGAIPLMYDYYGSLCLGAGHGICGILQILLSFPQFLSSNLQATELIKKSVDFLLSECIQNQNMACDMSDALQPSKHTKYLVHWCHGAAGIIYMFARAYLVFNKDDKYLKVCRELSDTVWEKGLLKKGPGICHGIAGSGYVFLLMYRLTGEEKYLVRAERFASFIFTDKFCREATKPDCPFSLFEGLSGTICFLNDILQPHKAEFPLSDIFLDNSITI